MIKNVPGQITKAINRFDNAALDHAFIGASDPERRYDIQKEYEDSRKSLEDTIIRLVNGKSK